ncbi:BQ2448_5595 [Microbotryum intermedium]|uniref:Beta-mannosidase B n=1 Tax=Microbotryum intermedium TaxID=269621 RepID=A0A238F2L7_9BASI|nr:BQ2448_5595 [Microbotryum intermedium]
MKTLNLSSDASKWEWRQSPVKALTSPEQIVGENELESGWTRCVQMPSMIQVELLAVGKIPDPYKKCNDELVQWVGEEDWLYRTSFDLDRAPQKSDKVDLVFEGLDTFATVFFNGKKILESDNMFTPERVTVSEHVKQGENHLVFVFTSAVIKGRMIEQKHMGKGKHMPLWNGDAARLFVRKAGYGWGWDWGPTLMTAGPWKEVRVEIFADRIIDLHPVALVSEKLDATLTLEVDVTNKQLTTNLTVLDPAGKVFKKVSTGGNSSEKAEWSFKADEIELWWSVGLGAQPLYTAQCDLVSEDGKVLHTVSKRFGFRRLRLVQEPLKDQEGTSFYFEVNNVAQFCGGSNWIPIDNFITNGTEERYRSWLQLLIDSNQNMIRVWAGGIYEHDCFYDACDEMGILVWQDFMFGCGAYPAFPEFVESVRREAEAAVLRLRSHPCMSIYAGNNEDYREFLLHRREGISSLPVPLTQVRFLPTEVAEQCKLDYDPEDHTSDWTKTNFPAREIYEHTLPKVVNALTDVFYHPGSPWGGKDTTDKTVGDVHQWNVWHGSQQRYQDWDLLSGRFVSEFGMQGLPDIRTMDDFINGEESERHVQSRTVASHNKADGYERRLELYLVENIRHSFKIEDYVFATQFIQAETLSTAYRLFRREFKGPGRAYCSGALVWQLNDVYPCTSWSIVDYYERPKPAYYAIKQSMAPIACGMKRYYKREYPEEFKTSVFVDSEWVEIWAVNGLVKELPITLVVEAFELLSGEKILEQSTDFTLAANQSNELIKKNVPKYKKDPKAAVVVTAKIVDPKTKKVLSRFLVYPEPYKFLVLPDEKAVNLDVKVDVAKGEIRVKAERPVKGWTLWFSDDVKLSDNALDLIPGDERIVKVAGLKETTKVSWRYLGDKHVP